MTSNQFYVPRIAEEGSRIVLEGQEHHHLAKVARVRAGRTVWLFDAGGIRCRARVEDVRKDRTLLRIIERENPAEGRVKVTLAQALLTIKKMEFILQKATELGVSEFLPVETVRSLRISRLWSANKAERWERIAREAAKQSKRPDVPSILAPRPLTRALEQPAAGGLTIFLSEDGGKALGKFLLGAGPAPGSIALFVGPEGGWTEGEVAAFRAAGCEAVSLGPRTLRTETAALAAVALVSHFWNG